MSRRRLRSTSSTGINYFAYSYVDGANPVFGTNWGSGNKANGRVNIAPTGQRIIIDGTTSTNGNYKHVADLAAAKAIYAAGDWILYPGGQTSTPSSAVNFNSMVGGTSLAVPTVVGTFDPADKENDAKYNTLRHTMDFTSVAAGNDCLTANATGGNWIWNSFIWTTPLSSGTRAIKMGCSLTGNGKSGDNLLFENITTDGINFISDQGVTGLLGCTITRSGTTATVTLAIANSLLQTGDMVGITGANETQYNTPLFGSAITVTDSTHFTYQVSGSPATPATGSIIYEPAFARIPDSFIRKNVEFRYCGLMYGSNGTSSGTLGNVYLSGVRQVRVAACVDFHGGWGRGITRATAAASGGPSILAHGFYIDDFADDVKFLDHINAWDSCNLKFTGSNYFLQNHVSVRCPMSWIYDAGTGNHNFTSQPGGSTFKSQYHLAYDSADCNSADGVNRGYGPTIYQPLSGSYYKNGVLLNADPPVGNPPQGVTVGSNGFTATYALLMDACVLGNWNFQDTNTAPDVHTTVTFTNNEWDNASSGSNTQISSLPAPTQTKITNAIACNVHTSLRTALPTFFGGVSVGGSNLITETNMMEYCCNNPIPDATKAMGWAIVFQYHVRQKLA